jgi:hypothetical protein
VDILEFLSEPARLALLIPIVAIIFGSLTAMVSSVVKHRERMAMIEMGIHPDHPPDESADRSQAGSRPPSLS